MSPPGILYFLSAASLPWQVSHVNFLNFSPSNVWKTVFIFGMTADFMYERFWANFMSFPAAAGGSTTFASAGRPPECRRMAAIAAGETTDRIFMRMYGTMFAGVPRFRKKCRD